MYYIILYKYNVHKQPIDFPSHNLLLSSRHKIVSPPPNHLPTYLPTSHQIQTRHDTTRRESDPQRNSMRTQNMCSPYMSWHLAIIRSVAHWLIKLIFIPVFPSIHQNPNQKHRRSKVDHAHLISSHLITFFLPNDGKGKIAVRCISLSFSAFDIRHVLCRILISTQVITR